MAVTREPCRQFVARHLAVV